MRKSIYFLGLLFLSTNLLAQQITGTIKDHTGKNISGATVSLLNAKDSTIFKLSVSKDEGRFSFSNINSGNYLVSVSHVGHVPAYSSVFQFADTEVTVPEFQLQKSSGEMKGITVTGKKPMVEVKADKTILNVEGTINAVGSDVLELLRKSPGVAVDRDDNINLSGKNGVRVYIDGRPSPLAGKDLSDYLKTLQSSQVEAIEIITNPSAKYDAAGNAGIINIRLKKNKNFGTNGSVNAGWNIGTLPKYNAGLSLNNRNQHTNLFGTYSYNNSNNLIYMRFNRTALDTLFNQTTDMLNKNKSHNFKAGLDYFISSRSTLGFVANGTIADVNFSNDSRTPISYIPTKQVSRILVANNTNEMQRNNSNFNLNYRYADTTGHELNLDADYGIYHNNSDQMQPNIYYQPNGQTEINRLVYNMLAPTDIDLFSIKGDYEQNYKGGKLGLGVKTAYVKTDNDFQRYNVYTTAKALDTLRSNRFEYKENINAGYINYNKPMKGWMFQVGLRVENTTSKGRSTGFRQVGSSYISYDSGFTRPYTDLFPSAAVTFNKNPMSQFGVTYSRRIDRPAYQDLNPFEFKLDEYTFMKGNTDLRPQYTNSFGITHTFKYKLNTALNYSHVKDVFTQLPDTTERSKSFLSKKNLATQDIISLNISYPFSYKSFSSFANLNAYYSKYEADFGEGRKVNLDVPSFTFFAQNSLRFAKTWTGEVSGWYSAPSIWQGTFESDAMWSVDAGLQKQVFGGKGNIKASVSDIFKSMKWGGQSNFAGQMLKGNGGWESRLFKINFSYRFGNSQVKAARQRKSGLDDEKKEQRQETTRALVNNGIEIL